MNDTTIRIQDIETHQEAIIIIRHAAKWVVLELSHIKDGDLQVVMTKDDAKKLVQALNEATK